MLKILDRYVLRELMAPFWLSPLADIAAVLRVVWSTFVRPRSWRGRTYR